MRMMHRVPMSNTRTILAIGFLVTAAWPRGLLLASDLGGVAALRAPPPPELPGVLVVAQGEAASPPLPADGGALIEETLNEPLSEPTDDGFPHVTPSPGTLTGFWGAGVECLYGPGEPRALSPCIPGPPCHPSHPPMPYDLVGVDGVPTCGPIYGGPCEPRTGTHDDRLLWRMHRVRDRFFDWFYTSK